MLLFLAPRSPWSGRLGLLRLGSFYERVHAPTLGTTLGTGCIVVASMIFFSVLETRPVLHEVLIAVFVTMTTPVTLIVWCAPPCFATDSKAPKPSLRSGPKRNRLEATRNLRSRRD